MKKCLNIFFSVFFFIKLIQCRHNNTSWYHLLRHTQQYWIMLSKNFNWWIRNKHRRRISLSSHICRQHCFHCWTGIKKDKRNSWGICITAISEKLSCPYFLICFSTSELNWTQVWSNKSTNSRIYAFQWQWHYQTSEIQTQFIFMKTLNYLMKAINSE